MNAWRLGLMLLSAWIFCDSRRVAASPAPSSAPADPAVSGLIDQLNSEKYQDREAASHKLAGFGDLIRPALIAASRPGQPPELRSRAAQLLCSLSWATPDDPQLVRQALTYYSSTNPEYRVKAALQLGLIGESAFGTLVRLLHEEPSDDVRWALVTQLRRFTSKEQRQRLQQLDTAADDAPLLAACGWAWQSIDPARGDALLSRAADLAALHPVQNLEPTAGPRELRSATELQQVLRWLCTRALHVGRYDVAALRMRQLILQSDEPLSEAMLDLFVIHADHGPQPGFDEDLRLARESFYSPEMMYILGRMYERQNQPLLATALYRSAAAAGLSTQETHVRLARFLHNQRWRDLEQVECQLVLNTDGPQKTLLDAEAYVLLSSCAAARGDDAQAAQHLSSALQTIAQVPGVNFKFASRIKAEIDWYSLRVAVAQHDKNQTAQCVQRLLEYQPADADLGINSEIEIDLVAGLKALDRADEAAPIFTRRYEAYLKQLDAEPFNPEMLNNIAWFSARCNEQPEKALHWAQEAVRLAPADAAYFDTAAEAAAKAGRLTDAIAYESNALHLQPGEPFMMSQLLRFKAEASKQKQP